MGIQLIKDIDVCQRMLDRMHVLENRGYLAEGCTDDIANVEIGNYLGDSIVELCEHIVEIEDKLVDVVNALNVCNTMYDAAAEQIAVWYYG